MSFRQGFSTWKPCNIRKFTCHVLLFGVQSEGTTAQIGVLHIDLCLPTLVQCHNFEIYLNKTCAHSPIKSSERLRALLKITEAGAWSSTTNGATKETGGYAWTCALKTKTYHTRLPSWHTAPRYERIKHKNQAAFTLNPNYLLFCSCSSIWHIFPQRLDQIPHINLSFTFSFLAAVNTAQTK